MIEVRFPAPTAPWSTNEDRLLYRYVRNTQTQAWRGAARAALLEAKVPSQTRGLPLIVRLTVPFAVHRRRDPHNYCGTVLKAVIDGVVDAGVVPDDNPRFIGHREPVLSYDRTHPYGVVILRLEASDEKT